MSEEATISLRRRPSYFGPYVRKFSVFVDGQKIGTIGASQYEPFKIAPGKHKIYVRGLIAQTQTIELNLSAGETKYFECGLGIRLQLLIFIFLVFLVLVGLFFPTVIILRNIVFLSWVILLAISMFKPGARYSLTETGPTSEDERKNLPNSKN